MKIKHNKLFNAASVVSVISLLLLGSGCASIVHGGARNLSVNTQPTGAKVAITKSGSGVAVHSGVTPLTVSLDPKRGFFKGQSYNLKLELANYKTTEITIHSKLSGWYWGNIVFGGLIGMLIVDPATGAMWNLAPDKNAVSSIDKTGFVVVLVQQTTAIERANMVRIN